MRGWWLIAGMLFGCTSSDPAVAVPTPTATPASPAPAPVVPVAAKPSVVIGDDCDSMLAGYLEQRAAQNRCETDSDCAEMWPGLCPHGPYYVHRESDPAGVLALEQAIVERCRPPDCEPPMALGIAHCAKGRCFAGRDKPPNEKESCWDQRETYLEANGATDAVTVATIRGVTPHVVVAPVAAGTLAIDVDWPKACSDCRLVISEHNSGMSRIITPKSTVTTGSRNGAEMRHERLEFAVTPGPYHMIGMAAAEQGFVMRAELRDAAGGVGAVTRHGVAWQRLCEG